MKVFFNNSCNTFGQKYVLSIIKNNVVPFKNENNHSLKKICLNVSKCANCIKNVSKVSKMCQKFAECFKMYQIVQNVTKMCKNMSKCAKCVNMCQNVRMY